MTTHDHVPAEHRTSTVRIVISWLLVSIPLLWGVSQTVIKALALFR